MSTLVSSGRLSTPWNLAKETVRGGVMPSSLQADLLPVDQHTILAAEITGLSVTGQQLEVLSCASVRSRNSFFTQS